jgi:hypothetical protein
MVICIAIIANSSSVLAIPALPSSFYGTVNRDIASDGGVRVGMDRSRIHGDAF